MQHSRHHQLRPAFQNYNNNQRQRTESSYPSYRLNNVYSEGKYVKPFRYHNRPQQQSSFNYNTPKNLHYSYPRGRYLNPNSVEAFDTFKHFRRKENNHKVRNRRPHFGSHGKRELLYHPKYAFSSSKIKNYNHKQNSILGSGNFEILAGGTFYDEDDYHMNHNPYEPYLDDHHNEFRGKRPYKDDDEFFSNFRDFSEFANRRSGSSHASDPNGENLVDMGFASEIIPQYHDFIDLMTSGSTNAIEKNDYNNETEYLSNSNYFQRPNKNYPSYSPTTINLISMNIFNKESTKESKDDLHKKKDQISSKNHKARFKSKERKSNKTKPHNIQDVLKKLETLPTRTTVCNISQDNEEDPMMAIF